MKEALSRLLIEKNKECTKKIEEIMERMYADKKNTPLFRKVRNSLVEASKQLIKINSNGMTDENIKSYTSYVDGIIKDIENLVLAEKLPKEDDLQKATLHNLYSTLPENTVADKRSRVFTWELQGNSKFRPFPENGALTLKCQGNISLRPNEIKVIELGVRVHDKKGYKHEMVLDSYSENSKITMNTDLLCSGTNEYCKVSLQNRQNTAVKIPEGSPIVNVYIYRVEGVTAI
jgi:hypothetical protein